jgi:hypothetical protein
MPKYMISETDALTNETVVREMTIEEIAQIDLDKAARQAIADEKEAKEVAKANAQAKLAALGLTADDLKALGLGNN